MNYKIFPSLMQSTKYGLQRVSNGCTVSFEPNLSNFRQNVSQVINDTEESIWKQELEQAGWVNPEHAQFMEAVIQNIDFYDGGICRWCGAASLNPHLPGCEMYMLEAYRKERGLL